MIYLCVPIFVTDLEKARRDLAQAAEAGADMIELRIDTLEDTHLIEPLLKEHLLPIILTCRPNWEGGFSDLDDEKRIALLTSHPALADYLDLELKTARKHPLHDAGKWIISYHDFTERPQRLFNLLDEMNQFPASVNKIVWQARSIRDNLEAFDLLQHRKRPTIALCMGEAGIISRILAKKFGSMLSFASLDNSKATAPGQVAISEMKNLYRWDAIGPSTKIFGVVAHPVRHSMSPAIHNAAFDATGYDGVYLPLLVEPSYESFKAFIETFVNFHGLDLSGLSVTIPHKQNALRYLREKGAQVEELAVRIGAVNTIAIDRADGTPKLSGSNTDYAAILDSITEKMGIGRDGLRSLRVAVLGAGGTGRAAVAALAHYGASVFITNRTQDRARELAAEFNATAVSLPELPDADCHVWINTTSVGMHPKINETPLGDLPVPFTNQTLVFDTVYNPMKTKLLQQAEQAGSKTISGVEMFVRQAAAQFSLWTAKPAPTDVMRHIVQSRLSEIQK